MTQRLGEKTLNKSWSSKLGVVRQANDLSIEKEAVNEPYTVDRGGVKTSIKNTNTEAEEESSPLYLRMTPKKPKLSKYSELLKPKTITRIAYWNVRTLYAAGTLQEVAREMKKYQVDVLGISETRWIGCGNERLSTGEQFIYSGKKEPNASHERGVGLLMTRVAERALLDWEPISERIIKARFKTRFKNITVVNVYAPTNDASEEEKLSFYDQLQSVVEKVPKRDVCMVIGDLNAKIGSDNEGMEMIMGKHGLGTQNENGLLFAEFCLFNNLCIGGSLFPHKDIHKATWVSPDGRTKNQIDHCAISKPWRSSLIDVKVHRGADAGSDHFFGHSKGQVEDKSGAPKQKRQDEI